MFDLLRHEALHLKLLGINAIPIISDSLERMCTQIAVVVVGHHIHTIPNTRSSLGSLLARVGSIQLGQALGGCHGLIGSTNKQFGLVLAHFFGCGLMFHAAHTPSDTCRRLCSLAISVQ